jgi:acylglycerol lipase
MSSGKQPIPVIQPKGFAPLPADWISEWTLDRTDPAAEEVFCEFWTAKKNDTKRMLLIVHGHGEHGARYLHFPEALKSVVSACLVPDHRGHGRSGGLRGDIDRFDRFCEDIDAQLARHSGYEVHLYGHSLGGLIALEWLRTRPTKKIASAVISAPFLGTHEPVPTPKKAAAGVLKHLWPSLQLPTGLDPTQVSRDSEVVRAYTTDRLNHDKMTPRAYAEIKRVQNELVGKEVEFKAPILFLVPMADTIVDASLTLASAKKWVGKIESLRLDGLFHETHNEPERALVFEEVKKWISQHSSV